MVRQRSDSRNKIVEGARTLLRRQGYNGTGLAQIIEFSGAPRGSVYFLFPGGKEEIAVAAVLASRTTIPELVEHARDGATFEEWISAVLEHFANGLADSGFTEGCPITTTALEAVPQSKALTEACQQTYGAWHDAVVAGLADYGVPAKTTSSLATTLLSCLEGGLVLCRVQQSTAPLFQLEPHLIALVEAHLPQRGQERVGRSIRG